MSKCEWKDGKFGPCDGFNPVTTMSGSYPICSECHVVLTKPEPAGPLIVKSGETWVAHWEGVDYLWIQQGQIIKPNCNIHSDKSRPMDGNWIPFEHIELTDMIARLRPMVRKLHSELVDIDDYDLWGISKGMGLIEDPNSTIQWREIISIRLATAKELQEQNK